jgi:hypothetical protein
MVMAFLTPCLPVQQFALPELTTTAYTLVLLICSRQICTAADWILLVVNTAAAVAPAGHTISPRSNLPDFLIPQLTPAAKNPFGAVRVLFAIYIFAPTFILYSQFIYSFLEYACTSDR